MQSSITTFDNTHDLSTDPSASADMKTLFEGEIKKETLEVASRSLEGCINYMLLCIDDSKLELKTPKQTAEEFIQSLCIEKEKWEEYKHWGDENTSTGVNIHSEIFQMILYDDPDDIIPIELHKINDPSKKVISEAHSRELYDPYAEVSKNKKPSVGKLQIGEVTRHVIIDLPGVEEAEHPHHEQYQLTINAVHKVKNWISNTSYNDNALILICITENRHTGSKRKDINRDETCVLSLTVFDKTTLEKTGEIILKGDKHKSTFDTDIENSITKDTQMPRFIRTIIPTEDAHSEIHRTGHIWGIYRFNSLKNMFNRELKRHLTSSTIKLSLREEWPLRTVQTYEPHEENDLNTEITCNKTLAPYLSEDELKTRLKEGFHTNE